METGGAFKHVDEAGIDLIVMRNDEKIVIFRLKLPSKFFAQQVARFKVFCYITRVHVSSDNAQPVSNAQWLLSSTLTTE